MTIGFEFRETLSGSYYTLKSPGQEKPILFTVAARTESVSKPTINPTFTIEGEIDAEGFAHKKKLRGTMAISFWSRRFSYDVYFENDAGEECRLHGERDIELMRLVGSITTLPVTVFVEGKETARAVLRFDLRGDLVRLLKSFRIR